MDGMYSNKMEGMGFLKYGTLKSAILLTCDHFSNTRVQACLGMGTTHILKQFFLIDYLICFIKWTKKQNIRAGQAV